MQKKTLKSIPTTRMGRGIRLFKLTASVGAQAIGDKMKDVFQSDTIKKSRKILSQVKQAQKIAQTLSEMKGAAMKLGQILSIYGEHLFSKEVLEVLSRLQQNSDPLEFKKIKKIIISELGDKVDTELESISLEPIASASIGQVHSAVYKNKTIALKVQYPGIEESIDSDVNSLASLFSVLTALPSTRSFNEVTDEIKMLLKHETDYLREGKNIEFFKNYFKNDPNILIPEYFVEISTKRILATELIEGASVQEFAATASQDERNLIGKKFLEVFYNELFALGRVQTDPNFANYKIYQNDKLVLLDFGAVKEFSTEFRVNYRKVVRAALDDDYEEIRHWATELNFLKKEDPKELVDLHYQLVRLFMEPLDENKVYIWHQSDLHERIRKFAPKFLFAFKLRPPPRDIIFLNRKLIGGYFFFSQLKCEFNPRPLLEKFL